MVYIVGRGTGGDNKLELERVGDPEEVVRIAFVDFAGEDSVFGGPRTFARTAPLRVPGKERAFDKLPDPGAEIPVVPDHLDIGFIIFIASRDAPGRSRSL